ncbi:MAG: ELWxxDGT repeat protein, partial [Bacteroidia bacterium]
KTINPSNLTQIGDVIYFTASGKELWQTDLTYEGTQPVDLGDGKIIERASALFAFKDKLYFSFDSYFYVTDGTLNGTHPILDSSSADIYGSSLYYVADDLLYFHGYSEGVRKLFRTDGTKTGTFSLVPSNHFVEEHYKPQYIQNQFYFTQTHPSDSLGFVLWATDGTVENTRVITNSTSKFGVNRDPSNLVNLNDELFYICGGDSSAYELWKTNGWPEGTKKIKVFRPDRFLDEVNNLIVFNDLIYFNGSDTNSNNDVWQSDGTASGTFPIKNISAFNGPDFKGVLNNKLFFTVFGTGQNNLYYIDGQTGKIEFFLDIDQRPKYGEDFFHVWNGDAYFTVLDDNYVSHLWKSNGTPEGTAILADIPSYNGNYPDELVRTTTDLVFVIESVLYGLSIWKTDGSANGTQPVYFDSCCTGSSEPVNLTAHDNSLLFIARDFETASQIWSLEDAKDPSPITFNANRDFYTWSNSTQILGSTDDRIFYMAADTSKEVMLWLKESTDAAPIRVIPVGQLVYVQLKSFGTSNGIFFYSLDDNTGRRVLQAVFATSTIPKTIEIKKFLNTRIRIENITAYNDGILFTINDFNGNQELWYSDGSTAGTYYLRNVCLSPCYLGKIDFTFLNGLVYFVGYNLYGAELWVTDGTVEGTKIAVDVNSGLNSSGITSLTIYKNKLVFIADDGTNGRSIFSSDGTPAGTNRHFGVAQVDGLNNEVKLLAGTDDFLYFRVTNQDSGTKLWKTNMTPETTIIVRDLEGVNGSSEILNYTAFNNQFYFSAEHPEFGIELYVSDNSVDGARVVEDLYEGERGSNPEDFIIVNEKFYFTARDETIGRELFFIEPEPTSSDGHNSLTVFPNPSSTVINVVWQTSAKTEGAVTHIAIYDLLGKKVYSGASEKQVPQIDVSNLSNGMYIIKVSDALSGKFIKQ